MPTIARFDLKLDAADKDLLARAAVLLGTTMAGFVCMAAKEKALASIDSESRAPSHCAILWPSQRHWIRHSPPTRLYKTHCKLQQGQACLSWT
jgi:hypothetical protein